MLELPSTTAELVARLEAAGATLLALRVPGVAPAGFRSNMPEVVRSIWDAYDPADPPSLRGAQPDAGAISAMDQALGWLQLIPADRYVLRRIVGARLLVSPVTGRHSFSFGHLAAALGADRKAVYRWHAQGIALILTGLLRPGLCKPARGPLGAREDVGAALRRAQLPRQIAGRRGVVSAEFA